MEINIDRLVDEFAYQSRIASLVNAMKLIEVLSECPIRKKKNRLASIAKIAREERLSKSKRLAFESKINVYSTDEEDLH